MALSARVGFDGYCKRGTWIPIRVTLENSGPDLQARVQVAFRKKLTYSADVLLPAGSSHSLFVYTYETGATHTAVVRLLAGEQELASQDLRFTCLPASDRLVGLLVDDPSPFTPLSDVPLPEGEVRLAHLQPAGLPDQPQGWSGLDALVVSGVDTGRLTASQGEALRAWLAQGGRMLVVGGPRWQAAAAGVDELLPLQLQGTRTVDDLSALQVFSPVPLAASPGALLSFGRLRPDAAVLAGSLAEPLAATRPAGLGSVSVLSVDPAMRPLAGWAGAPGLYARLLRLDLTAEAWSDGEWDADTYSTDRALSTLSELGLPSFLYVCGWLLVYVVAIGPVQYLALRRLRRRELAWITIPALALLFTAGAYLAGALFRGRQPILNRLAVVQAWEGAGQAQVHGLVGLYSPRRARYDLQVEGAYKFHPYGEDPVQAGGEWAALQDGDRTVVTGVQVEIAGVQTVALEGVFPALAVEHDLVLRLGEDLPRMEGSLTNASQHGLQDALLVTPMGVLGVGDLPPGGTYEVHAQYLSGYASAALTLPDTSAISGHYSVYSLADETDLRREALVDAVVGYGAPIRWGFYLMGWIDAPVLPVTLDGPSFKAVDTYFYIARLEPGRRLEGAELYLPPGMFSWEAPEGFGAPGYAYVESFPVGGYRLTFRPAVKLEQAQVTSLTLNMATSESPTDFRVSLWDHQAGEWIPVEDLRWNGMQIPDPWRYVGPDGEVSVNVDSDLEWIEVDHVAVEMVVRP